MKRFVMTEKLGYLDDKKISKKVDGVIDAIISEGLSEKAVNRRGLSDIAAVLSEHLKSLEDVRAKHKTLDCLRIILNLMLLITASYSVWFVYASSHEIIQPFSFPASLIDVLTGFDSLANVGIFLFLSSLLASRVIDNYKNSDCLKRLDHLHQLIHVIDMHQVAKEAITLGNNDAEVDDSEKESIDKRFEQSKQYLDRVHELVVLAGKTAALYPRICNEHVVLTKVQGVEELSLGISTKLWQRYDRLERYYQSKTNNSL